MYPPPAVHPQPLKGFIVESVERKKLRSRAGGHITYLTTVCLVVGFIRSSLKHREVLLSTYSSLPSLQPYCRRPLSVAPCTVAALSQLEDGLAATPVLFELTSFPRYERESARLHRPSNFVQVAPIWISIRSCLHWRIGTPVRVSFGERIRQSSRDRLPSRQARERRSRWLVGGSESPLQEREDSLRDERGSNVAIVMSPVLPASRCCCFRYCHRRCCRCRR